LGVKNKSHNFLVNIGDEGFLLSSLMEAFDDEGAYYPEPQRFLRIIAVLY